MFIGHNFFAQGAFIPSCHTSKKIDSILMSNMIVDEFKIDETLDGVNSITKEEWGMDTALLAQFLNNLEAGNFTGSGLPVQFLRFKRRKIGELIWEIMIDIPYDKDIENYDIKDFYIEDANTYEYTLIPVIQSMEGTGLTSTIETSYSSLFLTGKDSNGVLQNYPLKFDLGLSDITVNEDKVVLKTLSSKYPAFMSGESQYLTGNVTSTLISPSTQEANGKVDVQSENAYRNSFEEFIHDDKTMLIRNSGFYILGELSDIKRNPLDVSITGIWTFTFSITETDDSHNMQTLKDNELTYLVTSNQ